MTTSQFRKAGCKRTFTQKSRALYSYTKRVTKQLQIDVTSVSLQYDVQDYKSKRYGLSQQIIGIIVYKDY